MLRHPRPLIEEKLSALVRLKYNKFQWWRNWKLKDTLHPNKPLLERIENGDFDHSGYYWMAQYALYELEDRQVGIQDLEKLRDIESLYMEKYRRLMEDYHKDEATRLQDYKKAVVKAVRITKEALEELMEDYEGTLGELYLYVHRLYNPAIQAPPGSLSKTDSMSFEEERGVEDLTIKS